MIVGARSRADDALLARLYTEALVRRGVRTKTALRLGNRRAALAALQSGAADIVIDDATAAKATIGDIASAPGPQTKKKSAKQTLDNTPPRKGAAAAVAALNTTIRPRGLVALLPTGAGETPVVVVRTETATKSKVAKVEELWRFSRNATLGGPPGCEQSLDCALGMRRNYGIRWDSVRTFADAQGALDALRAGDIDAAVLERTLSFGSDITRLSDDGTLLGVHPLVPIVRSDRLDADDRAEVDRVSAALDADGYAELLAKAHTKGAKQLKVVDEWLTDRGWIKPIV